jgi:hypothetical protein
VNLSWLPDEPQSVQSTFPISAGNNTRLQLNSKTSLIAELLSNLLDVKPDTKVWLNIQELINKLTSMGFKYL